MGFLTAPSTLLLLVLATGAAALFHLWQGEGPRDLALYWPVAVAGFVLGQLAANAMGFHFAMIGEVHILPGIALSFAAMLVAKWLKL
jgi:hypothetical protein